MDRYTYLNASEARKNFFDLLNKTYKGESFIIKKSGIPVAKISTPPKTKKRGFLDFAGMLKNIKAEKIIEYIRENRRDTETNERELPQLN